MSTGTAVAPTNGEKKPSQLSTIKGALESPQFKDAIARALPKHLTADRFLRVATTATLRTPKLLQCTQASLLKCLLDLSSFGLEADGRRAHLIPYENSKKVNGEWVKELECTLQLDWKGIAELVMRSGVVSFLHADVVRRGDVFIYSKGELQEHIPWFLRTDAGKPAEAGERFAAYSLARMKDGSEKCEVMPMEDIHAIRNKSQGWIAFQKGWAKQTPWNPAEPHIESEMWKKTVFKRLSKWLPLSPEIRDAIDYDNDNVDIAAANPSVITSTATVAGTGSKSDALAEMLAARHGNDFIEHDESNEGDPNRGEETQVEPDTLTQQTIIERLKARIEVATDLEQLKKVDADAGAIEDDDARTNIYASADKRREEIKAMVSKKDGKLPGT